MVMNEDGVREDERPINASKLGEWSRPGVERWHVVERSWQIFGRNTTELVNFLKRPAEDPQLLMQIVTSGPTESASFWEELDQRLHNQLAAAVSLVDHTRRLTDYYADDAPQLINEFTLRNQAVRELQQTAFLRDLRNYLLHYGVAPMVLTLEFKSTASPDTSHSIKMHAARLREWNKWNSPARAYLSEFEENDGPVVIREVVTYANAMQELYSWLFDQRTWNAALMPDRFRVDELPDDIVWM